MDAQGTQGTGYRRKKRPSDPEYSRPISALFHFFGLLMVVMIGIATPWIYYGYHDFGLVGYYLYFMAWLGLVIYLCGGMLFGRERHWWQLAVYAPLGILLGFCGGWFFAGQTGTWFGLATGMFLSPLIFFIRWWLLGLLDPD